MLYPYFSPGVVNSALGLAQDELFDARGPKPLLKRALLEEGFTEEFVYRKKQGFQPPRQQLLANPAHRGEVQAILSREDELAAHLTPLGRKLPCRLLEAERCLDIHELYLIWATLNTRLWLDDLRNGGLVAWAAA